MSCATAAMALARRASRLPRSRLTSAAARLIRPSARTISIGMRSLPMRKLCSERSVCAPQSLPSGISSGPKASLSVRVFCRVLAGFLAMPECKPAVAPAEGRWWRLFLLAETVEAHDFAAAGWTARLLGFGFGRCLRHGRWLGLRLGRRCNNGGRRGALLLGRLVADIGRRLAALAL